MGSQPREASRYAPGLIGPEFVLPRARGLKEVYLRLFGVPEVRIHLAAAHALPLVAGFSFTSALDVGCGNGMLTCLLAACYPDRAFVGIDRDGGALEFARALARQNDLDNVEFRQADAEQERISQHYDLVTSFGVLQFIGDIPALIRILNLCLRPGGALLLQLPAAHTRRLLMRMRPAHDLLPEFHEVRGGFTVGEISSLLTDGGFEVHTVRHAIRGPAILAKEIYYVLLPAPRWTRALACPLLNWVTVMDASYSGEGNGFFVLAQKRSGSLESLPSDIEVGT